MTFNNISFEGLVPESDDKKSIHVAKYTFDNVRKVTYYDNVILTKCK